MSCGCVHSCQKRLRGDNRACAPADRYFTIAKVIYVSDGQGGADRDDVFYPQRYATLAEALDVVRRLPPGSRYCVDDTPRMGVGPAWSGWPDQVPCEMELTTTDTETSVLTPTSAP